jgi:hypothetical protein
VLSCFITYYHLKFIVDCLYRCAFVCAIVFLMSGLLSGMNSLSVAPISSVVSVFANPSSSSAVVPMPAGINAEHLAFIQSHPQLITKMCDENLKKQKEEEAAKLDEQRLDQIMSDFNVRVNAYPPSSIPVVRPPNYVPVANPTRAGIHERQAAWKKLQSELLRGMIRIQKEMNRCRETVKAISYTTYDIKQRKRVLSELMCQKDEDEKEKVRQHDRAAKRKLAEANRFAGRKRRCIMEDSDDEKSGVLIEEMAEEVSDSEAQLEDQDDSEAEF